METILGNVSYTICGSSCILFIVEAPFLLLSASESYCERRNSANFETSYPAAMLKRCNVVLYGEENRLTEDVSKSHTTVTSQ